MLLVVGFDDSTYRTGGCVAILMDFLFRRHSDMSWKEAINNDTSAFSSAIDFFYYIIYYIQYLNSLNWQASQFQSMAQFKWAQNKFSLMITHNTLSILYV